ncbi:MAG: V-type ATP synthase subunit E [Lachnospiraceae bacterium]|jgi:V/A-type H+-transporting ATPase subunit E
MSGLDKIIEHIESSAAGTAAQIKENATAEAAKILEEGKKNALAKEATIRKQGEADVLSAEKKVQSEAGMAQKRHILNSKQAIISEVMDSALKKIQAMKAEEYFDIILRMVKRYAEAGDGTIRFNAYDLERMPEDFESRINEAIGDRCRLVVSRQGAAINGGFILDYGDIEENCSFEALLDASAETLRDKISRILFD